MIEFKNFIEGEWKAPSSCRYEPDINPADTSDVLGMYPLSTEEDVQKAIATAKKEFVSWSQTPGPERGKILYRFADLLEKHADELAEILTKEEGKILKEAKGEVLRAATESRFMAGEASRLLGEYHASEQKDIEVVRTKVPIGPIAVITPWNFPVVSPVRKISPALAYGNTVVFKPASLTPWTAVRLVELYLEAGVPPGVINLIMGKGSMIGNILCESPDIKGITFTGSTFVGKNIFRKSAENLTKVQLEMGGKNPALVYNAEDLFDAAKQIVSAAFASSGQRCTAISRVIVNEKEEEELVGHMTELIKNIKVGPGLDPASDMGPLVSQDQIDIALKYMQIAEQEKCNILVGGKRINLEKHGYYFEPTLVTKVSPDSPLAKEEIFCPILSVISVKSFEEGITICNNTRYGLAGCVFTKGIKEAKYFARSMMSGMVHINHGTASQAHVPFGGVKDSGFGPYSIGHSAIDFFMNDKIVYIK